MVQRDIDRLLAYGLPLSRDPEAFLALRRKQILQLSRYGRQPFLSPAWGRVSVPEFREWYATLREIVEEEGSGGGEDG